MIEWMGNRPFVVAIAAGLCAQAIKVVTFLLVEKRINYRRFVEADGTPNMHSAATAALSIAVGLELGFDSLLFAVSFCLSAMVAVDTWNVKAAHSRQQELVELILERVSRSPAALSRSRVALSYTPVDVLTGTGLGIVIALLIV